MSENNITPPSDSATPSLPRQWHIMDSALLASFIIYLIAGVFLTLLWQQFIIGFGFTLVPSALTVPFTLLTLFVYRKTRLPSRFELLAAILAGGIALPFIFAWIFSE